MESALGRAAQADADLARAACLIIAAAVRDLLTDHDHEAPFDAVELELTLHPGCVTTDGTYWTAAGEQRQIDDQHGLYETGEWTSYLTENNRVGWEPLCRRTGSDGQATVYRLDLIRAAELPSTPRPRATNLRAAPQPPAPEAPAHRR
jgi:hypothetical protein